MSTEPLQHLRTANMDWVSDPKSDYLYWEKPKIPSLENAPVSEVGFVALCISHILP